MTGSQHNLISGFLRLNYTIEEVIGQLEKGERIVASLLKNVKGEIVSKLHCQMAEKIREVVKQIDEEFLDSPPMLLVTYFKNLDMDLQFNSTDDLPESMKN